MHSTKIVATLGPASSSPAQLRALIEAGVDVVRVNFSHGRGEDHKRAIEAVRVAANDVGRPVAVLQDLQGPKIRTGALANAEPVELERGQRFAISIDDFAGSAARVSTSYLALPEDVEPGDRILVSDGLIELRVLGVDESRSQVMTEVIHGGRLAERQGMNLPGVNISVPGVTPKDERDLTLGLEAGIDYVAISFVRRASDVERVKSLVAAAGQDVPVIAKIEKPEAVDALDAILDVSDGVMVARGDLGVELSPEKVPLVQKRIIEAANLRAKPVITATQMLESMIHNPRPTRAEASDVANAILDGTDAVMLSGETAVGKHPIEAVRTMHRISEEVQSSRSLRKRRKSLLEITRTSESPEAIAAAVAAVVRTLQPVSAIWVVTRSGTSARLVSQQRPEVPVLAFTPFEPVYRRLALLWGVIPVKTRYVERIVDLEREISERAIDLGLAKLGDTVVVTGSHPFGTDAPTNFMKIARVVRGE